MIKLFQQLLDCADKHVTHEQLWENCHGFLFFWGFFFFPKLNKRKLKVEYSLYSFLCIQFWLQAFWKEQKWQGWSCWKEVNERIRDISESSWKEIKLLKLWRNQVRIWGKCERGNTKCEGAEWADQKRGDARPKPFVSRKKNAFEDFGLR